MIVSTLARKEFAGNGVAIEWPFAIQVTTASELTVYYYDTVLGALQTLVLDEDYSIALNANQTTSPGGAITFPLSGSPMDADKRLIVVRDVPKLQGTDITSGSPASAVENALDYLTRQVQQLGEQITRCVRVPPDRTLSELPTAGARANTFVGFDEDGDVTTAGSVNDFGDPPPAPAIEYAITPGETAIGAVIVDPTVPPGVPDRYKINVSPGTTDMTEAVQTCINLFATNAPTPNNGVDAVVPISDYAIYDTLIIPRSFGWIWRGLNREFSRITKHTAGPFVRFDELNHSIKIENMHLRYATPQTDSSSWIFDVVGDNESPTVLYQAVIDNMRFSNAYGIFRNFSDNVIQRGSWGMQLTNWFINDLYGSVVKWGTTPAIGNPSVRMETIYVLRGGGAGLPAFDLTNVNHGTVDNIELNLWLSGTAVRCTEGIISVPNVNIENIEVPASAAGRGMFECGNGTMHLGHIRVFGNNVVYDVGAGQKYYILAAITNNAQLTCDVLNMTNFVAGINEVRSGSVFIANGVTGIFENAKVRIGNFFRDLTGEFFPVDIGDPIYLVDNVANVAAKHVYVERWNNDQWQENADADYTWKVGDPCVQSWTGTFTGTRTLTLPGPGGSVHNLFEGLRVTLHGGDAGDTYALRVVDSTGTLATIAAAETGTITCTWMRPTPGGPTNGRWVVVSRSVA